MASYCLLTAYQGTPGGSSATSGGFWKYTSGPSSIQVYCSSPGCSPCSGTASTKNVGDILCASSGCSTCTSCTVTTSNPCVDITASGVHVFTYSQLCNGDCCSPSPTCTGTLTIDTTNSLGVTIASSSQTCIETLSILKNGATNKATSSTYMTGSVTTQMCSQCGANPQMCATAQTWTGDAGKVANGFEINMRECQGAETCKIEDINFTAKRPTGLLVTSPTYKVEDYFGSCPSGSCVYNGSNDADVETFYTCIFTAMLNAFKTLLLDPAFTWELDVSCSSGILTVLLVNKNIVAGTGHWIGFLKNPVTDANGSHPANTIRYRVPETGCDSEIYETQTCSTFDFPNTLTLTGNIFGLSCFVIGGTPFTFQFGNVVSILNSDAFSLVASPVGT